MAGLTNPLKVDVDAAGHAITGVSELQAANAELGTPDGNFGVLLLRDGSSDITAAGLVAVIAGTRDPSTGFIGPVTPGSLYVRHVDADRGEVWAKTGGANTAWTKIAG